MAKVYLKRVREKFRLFNAVEECSHYESCDCMKYHNTPMYYADAMDNESKWEPSIHMPRWASRINLEITEVRVERLQDISEEDARREGSDKVEFGSLSQLPSGLIVNGLIMKRSYRYGFYKIWDSLYSKRGFGWDTNPWVWAIGFRMA